MHIVIEWTGRYGADLNDESILKDDWPCICNTNCHTSIGLASPEGHQEQLILQKPTDELAFCDCGLVFGLPPDTNSEESVEFRKDHFFPLQ